MKNKDKQLRDVLEDFAVATRTEILHREKINRTGCLDNTMIKIKEIFESKGK